MRENNRQGRAYAYCPECFKNKRRGKACLNCGFKEAARDIALFLPYPSRLDEFYLVGSVLGRGRTSIIYKAFDERSSSILALKEYYPSHLAERRSNGYVSIRDGRAEAFSQGISSIEREVSILREVVHDNVVHYRGILRANGTIYILMEFCGRENLLSYASRSVIFTAEEALKVMSPIFGALECLHDKKIIHCDVSPANIQLRDSATPILLDFGSAVWREGGSPERQDVVTHGYSAPELYDETYGACSPRTDVYSCGATLYFLATGEAPLSANSREIKDGLVPPRLKNSGLPPRFSAALVQALALDPADRPSSVNELAGILSGNEYRAPSAHTTQGERIKRLIFSRLAPIGLLLATIFLAVHFVYLKEVGKSSAVGLPPKSFSVKPVDFYVLRDVSLSIDQRYYDAVEAVLRQGVRPVEGDDGSADGTSYAHFAAYVTSGGTEEGLQPATDGDNFKFFKDRLKLWSAPRGFRERTNFSRLFNDIDRAISVSGAGGHRRRDVLVSILTDGIPDVKANVPSCPSESKLSIPIFDDQTKAAFRSLVRRKGIYLLVVLVAKRPECAGPFKEQWLDLVDELGELWQKKILIVALGRSDLGKDSGLKARIEEKVSATFRAKLGDVGNVSIDRRPLLSVRPVGVYLSDEQRENLDKGGDFYASFRFNPHVCGSAKISVVGAQLLRLDDSFVADLGVVGWDDRTYSFDSAPRNGHAIEEKVLFRYMGKAMPSSAEEYKIVPDIRAEEESKALGRSRRIRVDQEGILLAGLSESSKKNASRGRRASQLACVVLAAAFFFSVALILYWKLGRERFRRLRRILRIVFVDNLRYWVAGFLVHASILLFMVASLVSRVPLVWMLGVLLLGGLFLKSHGIIFRKSREALTRSDVVLACIDSIAIPFLTTLLRLLSAS